MSKKSPKPQKLEEALGTVLSCIDNQMLRGAQKSPDKAGPRAEEKSVQINDKVESLTSNILKQFLNQKFSVEALIVLSRSSVKSLQLLLDELGAENLGDQRTKNIIKAFDLISRDCREAYSNSESHEESVLN